MHRAKVDALSDMQWGETDEDGHKIHRWAKRFDSKHEMHDHFALTFEHLKSISKNG